MLSIPDNYSVESVLALGNTNEEWGRKELPNVDEKRVHRDKF